MGAGRLGENGPFFDGQIKNDELCQRMPNIWPMMLEPININNYELCMNNLMTTSIEDWNARGSPDGVIA